MHGFNFGCLVMALIAIVNPFMMVSSQNLNNHQGNESSINGIRNGKNIFDEIDFREDSELLLDQRIQEALSMNDTDADEEVFDDPVSGMRILKPYVEFNLRSEVIIYFRYISDVNILRINTDKFHLVGQGLANIRQAWITSSGHCMPKKDDINRIEICLQNRTSDDGLTRNAKIKACKVS